MWECDRSRARVSARGRDFACACGWKTLPASVAMAVVTRLVLSTIVIEVDMGNSSAGTLQPSPLGEKEKSLQAPIAVSTSNGPDEDAARKGNKRVGEIQHLAAGAEMATAPEFERWRRTSASLLTVPVSCREIHHGQHRSNRAGASHADVQQRRSTRKS
jgi:hypothetical protein